MTDAELVTGSARRPVVRLERHLADPPEVVWRALTEREQLQSWFPCDVIVDGGRWEAGAAMTFPFSPEVTLTGEVLEVDEPRRLAFTWGEEILRFELAADDGGTLLVLTDELPPDAAARNAAGWDGCLDQLAGIKVTEDAWRTRFDAYCARFQPVLGPQAGPPAGI
jgi:uncharacterized protein YndB with AHSA1/START domain